MNLLNIFSKEQEIEYIRRAYEVAEEQGVDPSTHTAAILVYKTGDIIAEAVNGFPPGVKHTPERLERPLKYDVFDHAERAVLYKAFKKGFTDFENSIEYNVWMTCAGCARGINGFGLKNIVGHQAPLEWDKQIAKAKNQTNWNKSIETAWTLMDELGINYKYIDAKIGGIKNLHSGQWFEP
ncbi:hypothetical protein K9L67_03745 [Candidatus Woesearchaeota archaeon]|nr:hypothetical protein [Candidatus Woesearchaeota archaeon]MCF7901315.1 hypothetical protein [Candidatus Woesearchaeota archaeon]MCF8013779.1 hypothetical protein [Candidatus Woesearchaeota archaeon]